MCLGKLGCRFVGVICCIVLYVLHDGRWVSGFVVGLGPGDVSLLERCPHFRGWYVQASMELGPEDVSLLERYPHFRG